MTEAIVLLGGVYLFALFTLNYAGVIALVRYSHRWKVLLDVPNERSSHRITTTRGAGIFFVWSALLSWSLLEFHSTSGFLPFMIIGGGLVAGVSFLDDLKSLRIRTRLFVHSVAGALFLSQLTLPTAVLDLLGPLAFLWFPAGILFIVGVTNLYNFMDGADGIAALHSVVLLLFWTVLCAGGRIGQVEGLLSLSLCLPLGIFLFHNWSPARVFMGDVGSTFLGFSFACLTLVQLPMLPHSTNFFALIMLMMPFLFDTTFTIATRFLRGEAWYLPHQQHLFQRLLAGGYGHSTVAVVYGVMTAYAGGLLLLIESGVIRDYLVGIPLFLLPYIMLYLWIYRLEQVPQSEFVPIGVEWDS